MLKNPENILKTTINHQIS